MKQSRDITKPLEVWVVRAGYDVGVDVLELELEEEGEVLEIVDVDELDVVLLDVLVTVDADVDVDELDVSVDEEDEMLEPSVSSCLLKFQIFSAQAAPWSVWCSRGVSQP